MITPTTDDVEDDDNNGLLMEKCILHVHFQITKEITFHTKDKETIFCWKHTKSNLERAEKVETSYIDKNHMKHEAGRQIVKDIAHPTNFRRNSECFQCHWNSWIINYFIFLLFKDMREKFGFFLVYFSLGGMSRRRKPYIFNSLNFRPMRKLIFNGICFCSAFFTEIKVFITIAISICCCRFGENRIIACLM